MGQIKNIKLHIVTDIKCNNSIYCYIKTFPNNHRQDDKGNYEFWQAPQQIPHTVCALWPFLVPHPEESVCVVWLPKCTNPKLQLGSKAKRRKTTGTGRMRHLKKVHRRSTNGFREGTSAKSQKKTAAQKFNSTQ